LIERILKLQEKMGFLFTDIPSENSSYIFGYKIPGIWK